MAHIEDELKALLNLTRINYKDVIDSSPYTLNEFKKKNRNAKMVIWRQFVVVFARLQGLRLAQAGEIVDQDHCMVIHAIKTIYTIKTYSYATISFDAPAALACPNATAGCHSS